MLYAISPDRRTGTRERPFTVQTCAEIADGLGNDAEYPLALAYAALAVRRLAQRMGPSLLGDAAQRVLLAGFDSGDFLCIGAVQKDGLVYSRSSAVMAS
ncbi:hypothetical protein [Myxococcus sp. NMCA1]|uniref:hypothetical protein n=1 Tax=Myxococcus sp. NMCA1 TaxID=2996785 RepID=UPI002286B27C|nr:hypothetical protein [Myxococcus sp. NMCA1]WAM23338.1 hypothetical protein OZ403_22500 [Myxococcus sp. NMCA1]